MLRVLIEDRHFSITRGCKEYLASFVESKHEEDWQETGKPPNGDVVRAGLCHWLFKQLHDSLPSAGGSYFIFNRYMTVSLGVAVISFSTDTWQFH